MDLPHENQRLITRSIVYNPDIEKGIECYVDSDFVGGWDQSDTDNAENSMSHMGYVKTYTGCPLLLCSKLQTKIAWITTEAEYIALNQAMREVIPFMALMKEVYYIFDIHLPKLDVFCKLFLYNQSYIYVAYYNKLSPGTKHIPINYHHFRSSVKNKNIRMCYIVTREQTADIFTKPLDKALFVYLQRKLPLWCLKK